MKNELNELDALLDQQLAAMRDDRDDRDLAEQITAYLEARPALAWLLFLGRKQFWQEQVRGRRLSLKLHALLRKDTTKDDAERIADDVCEYLDQTADLPCGAHAEILPLDEAGVAHFFSHYDEQDSEPDDEDVDEEAQAEWNREERENFPNCDEDDEDEQ
jgi:hypothetical protein